MPRRPCSRDARSSRGPKMAVEERGYPGVGVEAVPQLGEAVSLVLVEQVLDKAAVSADLLHDLLRLPDRHAGVVLAVDDHERGRYAVCFVDGAYGPQKVPVLLEGAVLGLAQLAPV